MEMDEWEEREVVRALKSLFNIPKHWHFDIVKLQLANRVLREVAREGTLVVREKKSVDRGEFTQMWSNVYLRFELSGNEYFIDTISYTADDDFTTLEEEGIVFE